VPEDVAFDEQLPINLQLQAGVHFTPVAVARVAAQLLAPHSGMSVLDVGSGAGKFCITAASAIPEVEFVGVEWRPYLIQVARSIAARSAVSNVQFIQADALDIDWSEFDAFYFFNPFAEQMFDEGFKLDGAIASDPLDFITYVGAVRQRLARARLGTRVVTFHGFGATPPLCYEFKGSQSSLAGRLELWVKTSQ
jgi:SAM-dependent methyltransferase